MPGPLRRYGMLDDDERRRRPEAIRRLRFEDLTTPGPQFRDTSGVVPIEAVRAGDLQVLAARGRRPEASDAMDLDVLEQYPSVASVVATTLVRARRPLSSVAELFLFAGTPPPDLETMRHLPGLRRVWFTWCRGRPFDLSVLPASLEALGIAAHLLATPVDGDRFAIVQRFRHLRHLTLRSCLQKDNVRSIAALSDLVTLDCDAPNGWAQLRTCVALEDVTAIQPRMTNLRSLRTWARLRRLALVVGSGFGSLDGIEAFENLEMLRLVLVREVDISPLEHLPKLAEVSINSFGHPVPLEVFATLPSLRSLTIETPGDPSDIVHVDTLRPLRYIPRLETLTLRGIVPNDRKLAFLGELPSLARLVISGDLDGEIEELRRLRPDVEIRFFSMGAPPATDRVGFVRVRPPAGQSSAWWIREDLATRLSFPTNYDAETRVRRAIESTDPAAASRLAYDTEADAVCIYGTESDVRAAAKVISGLAEK